LTGSRPAYHSVDITDEAALDKVFDAHPEVDSVIHFAALKVSCALSVVCVQVGLQLPSYVPVLASGDVEGCLLGSEEYLLTMLL
jgi:hypothetical protein